jgi:hypothetical protein
MNTTLEQSKIYGYGHTKEASQLVRETLKHELAKEIKAYGLVITVQKANSGYGGPRVQITTNNANFDSVYEYIVDENGQPADSGRLVRVSTYKTPRPHYSARLLNASEINETAKAVSVKIRSILSQFGKDNDDAMTDYFDNTTPLYYGVEFIGKEL